MPETGGADTGEDEAITMDTTPIRGAVLYRIGSEAVAPGVLVYFATDDETMGRRPGATRVPAQSLEHAEALAETITMVELQFFGSSGWLAIARRWTLAVILWLNRCDVRTREF